MSTNTPINTGAGEGRCWLVPPLILNELIVDSAQSLYLTEFHVGCPSCRNPFHLPLKTYRGYNRSLLPSTNKSCLPYSTVKLKCLLGKETKVDLKGPNTFHYLLFSVQKLQIMLYTLLHLSNGTFMLLITGVISSLANWCNGLWICTLDEWL